jgi:pimeloyl-ACP methyl ester carboxylesterase
VLRLFWFLFALTATVGWWLLHVHPVLKALLAVLAIACLVLAIFLADSWAADLLYRSPVHKARIQFYPSTTNKVQSVIYLPGLQNSGYYTVKQYLTGLRREANVLVVTDYPRNGFDGQALFNQLMRQLGDHGLRDPGIIGMSFGGTVGIDFIRRYQTLGSPNGPVRYLVAIGVPSDKQDLKSPLAKLTPILRAGPLTRALYPHLQDLFFAFGPKQVPQRGVDPELVKQHQSYIRNFDAAGAFEQVRFIYRARPPSTNEFRNIPALILQTRGIDVLVKKQYSSPKLAGAFPHHQVIDMPGIHANLVEEFPAYQAVIEGFLSQPVKR